MRVGHRARREHCPAFPFGVRSSCARDAALSLDHQHPSTERSPAHPWRRKRSGAAFSLSFACIFAASARSASSLSRSADRSSNFGRKADDAVGITFFSKAFSFSRSAVRAGIAAAGAFFKFLGGFAAAVSRALCSRVGRIVGVFQISKNFVRKNVRDFMRLRGPMESRPPRKIVLKLFVRIRFRN